MTKRWYVIDDSGYTTYDERTDKAESFSSLGNAARCAKEQAIALPGRKFYIAEAIQYVATPVGSPEIWEIE